MSGLRSVAIAAVLLSLATSHAYLAPRRVVSMAAPRPAAGTFLRMEDTDLVPALNLRSGILQVVEPSDRGSVAWLMRHMDQGKRGGRSLLSHAEEMALGEQIRRLAELETVRDALAEAKTEVEQTRHTRLAAAAAAADAVSMSEWAAALDMSVQELKKTISRAKAARAEMIKSNLALVVSIAKAYRHRGLPLSDLIQEGAVGLAVAAARYDPSKGFRFSTYATYWVRQKIQRAVVDSGRVIRLPAHVHELKARAGKEWKNLEDAHGRPPSMEELAAQLGVTNARLATVVATDHTVFSMDRTLDRRRRESATVGDLLPCESPCPEELVQHFTLKEVIDGMVNRLPEREASILRMRFGLDDGQPKTVSEVGAVHSCSKERVRLIENRALFKLRSRSSNHALRELMDIDFMDFPGQEDAAAAPAKAGAKMGRREALQRETVAVAANRADAFSEGSKPALRSISKRSRGSTSLRRPQ